MGTGFEVFGGARIVRDGVPVALSKQLRTLLGVLLAAGRRPVPTEAVVERLWVEGAAPATAAKIVHIGVSKLRQAIGADDARALRTESAGYVLDAEPDDLRRWSDAVETARRLRTVDPGGALAAATVAIETWTGRPWGAQADAAWLRPQVDELAARHSGLEELRAELLLASGEPDEAVAALEAAVAQEPLRERRWEQLMLALYRAGRQADALRAFQRAREVLRSELGIEPGPGLRRLELAVLQQAPELDAATVRADDVQAATSFVGRDAELAELGRVLERQRLVTVTGIGGIGKSRLVREFAHRAWPEAEVRFVALGVLEHPEGFSGHVAQQLGIVLDGPTDVAVAVAAAVRGRVTLLVVDAAEHHLDEVTGLVLELLDRCRGLRVVVTSRVPLGIGDERQLRLGPLPADDGAAGLAGTDLALMIDRAGYDAAALDADSLTALRDACAAAAGIPMLVELAARAFDLGGPVPAAPLATAADPQVLVAAAIGNSLEAIDDATAELLARAAVLPAGVTETTAAGLAGVEPRAARRSLRQLAWLHLVDASAARAALRYRSLDPIRAALLDRLGPEATASAVARAAAVVHGVAAAVWPEPIRPVDLVALDRAEDEHENLRFLLVDRLEHDPATALELAIAASEYFAARGHGPEANAWLDRTIAAAIPEGPRRWRAELAYARATRTLAEVATRRPQLDAVVAEAREGDDVILFGAVLMYAAIARGWSGDRAGAAAALREATAFADDLGNPWVTAHVDHLRVLDAALRGDFAAARVGQRDFAARMLELDDPLSAAAGYYLAAALGDMAGETDGLAEIEAARDLATAVRDVSLLGRLVVLEARLLRRTGDPRGSALLRTSAEQLEQLGGVRAAALARRDLGLALHAGDDDDAAITELRRSAEVLSELDAPAARPAFAALAAIARDRGQATLADALAGRARVEPIGTPPLIAEDARVVAELLAGFPPGPPPESVDADLLAATAVLVGVPR